MTAVRAAFYGLPLPRANDPTAAPNVKNTFWDVLVARFLSFRPAVPRRWPRAENWAIAAVFALSGAVQFNAVLHDGSLGQNYPGFFNVSVRLAAHPGNLRVLAGQGPPLAFLINAAFVWLTGNLHAAAVCGIFNLCFNLGALWTFYGLACRFISSEIWRITLLILVAFLPLRLIHAVVLSGDALTASLLFALAGVAAALTAPAGSAPRRLRLALGAGGLLTLGVLTKQTFLSALAAMLLIVLQLVRRRLVGWREAARLWACLLVLPLSMVCVQEFLGVGFSSPNLPPHPHGVSAWQDVFCLYGQDARIFAAPSYHDPTLLSAGNPSDPALIPCSYAALTHLGLFTDPLNIFQYDPADAYFGARSERSQTLMARAVRTAVPISLLCLAAMALLSLLVIVTGLGSPARSRPDLEAVYLLAVGWSGGIVLSLPFMLAANEAGSLLSRLAMPGLLLCMLLSVYVLARLARGKAGRVAAWTALVYVACQSALQVTFLWPWGQM